MPVGALKSNAVGFLPSKSLGSSSGVVPLLAGVEGAAQSWKKGAVLINSAGKIVVAAADAVAEIVGVAAGPASGVTDREVLYYPARPGMIFECTLENQNLEDHALVITNMFINIAIHLDNNGIFYVDINDVTNTACVIVGYKDALGTVRARVFVEFEVDKTVSE